MLRGAEMLRRTSSLEDHGSSTTRTRRAASVGGTRSSSSPNTLYHYRLAVFADDYTLVEVEQRLGWR
jgi:hypothetical protein